MLFKKLTKCKVRCTDRNLLTDRMLYEFLFEVIEPSYLSNKTMYLYDRDIHAYYVDTKYLATFNDRDGEFIITKKLE